MEYLIEKEKKRLRKIKPKPHPPRLRKKNQRLRKKHEKRKSAIPWLDLSRWKKNTFLVYNYLSYKLTKKQKKQKLLEWYQNFVLNFCSLKVKFLCFFDKIKFFRLGLFCLLFFVITFFLSFDLGWFFGGWIFDHCSNPISMSIYANLLSIIPVWLISFYYVVSFYFDLYRKIKKLQRKKNEKAVDLVFRFLLLFLLLYSCIVHFYIISFILNIIYT